MNVEALFLAMEQSPVLDSIILEELNPNSPVEHAVFAAACFVAGDIFRANDHIEAALTLRPDLVSAPWLAQRVFADLPAERFTVPELHPWFGLQWISQSSERVAPQSAQQLGEFLLRSAVEAPICKAKIFEHICETRLRPTSLRHAETADWLSSFLNVHASRAPVAASLYQACLDHSKGNIATAEAGFRAFCAGGHIMAHSALGAATYLASADGERLRARDFRIISLAEGSKIVFTAEPNYLTKWSDLILHCLERAPCEIAVHFHIVADNSFDLPVVPKNMTSRVGFSREHDPGFGKAYYAASRFIVAPHLLSAYQSPLLFSDIDAAFDASVGELFDWLSDVPAAFLIKQTDNHFPWRSVSAGLCYLRPTEDIEKFLRCIAQYLNVIFDSGRGSQSLWWCDQNALAFALRETGLGQSAMSFFDVRRAMGQLPFRFAPNHSIKKHAFMMDELERG